MNWNDYARLLSEYRARFGRMPSSMLTDDGAVDQMQEALGGPAETTRAAPGDGRPRAPRRREQGH